MADAHKRKRHPKYKTRYRIKNWPLYEEGLRARGDITLWFSADVMDTWLSNPTGKPGRQRQYSELVIETILTLRLVFKLPLRQVEGFTNSLFAMMELPLKSPDHTTLSRRNKTLRPTISSALCGKGPLDIVVDSTGLSIHGEGRWRQEKYGNHNRRGWRKLHVAVDNEGLVLSCSITDETRKDASQAPRLLKAVPGRMRSFTADGGYDERGVYAAVAKHSSKASVINPPCVNAQKFPAATAALKQRNKHIKAIATKGVYRWRRESGYYRQSVVEKSIYRYKQIIGPGLRARNDHSRNGEAALGCKILNRSRALGMPQSYKVT